MKSLLTNLQNLTGRRVARLVVILFIGLTLAASISFGLRAVRAFKPKPATAPFGTFTATIAEISSDPTSLSPVQFSVTFGEAIDPASFTPSDVTLAGTGNPTTVAITEIAPNNQTTYRLDVTGMANTGFVNVSIAAGNVLNVGGTNSNSASTPSSGANIIRWIKCSSIPATIPDGDVTSLQDAITCANETTGDDTINLTSGGTYTVTSAANGSNGLPQVGHATINEGTLTINGNGAIITRSSAATFRFFEVLAGANLKLDSVKLTNGGGASGGGAIDVNSGGTMTLTNSTVSGNSALVGGGIRNNGGTLTVGGSTVSGNTATTGVGGGITNPSGTLTVINSTISGNTSSTNTGGGINIAGGTVTVTNSTITGNSANSGGGVRISSGTLTLNNTIVIGNTGAAGAQNCSGTITGNYSLTQASTGCSTGGTNITAASAAAVLNTTLANNGGWTQTHALASGSAALNAGDDCVFTNTCSPALGFALLTDQRGATRKSGSAVDIGAVEVAPFVTNTPAGTALNNALADTGDGSLRQEIADAGAGETIFFDPAFFNVQRSISLTSAELLINKNLTIDGGTTGVTITRSGATQFRIFNISSGTVAFNRLTISNGNPGSNQAGGIQNNGTLTMTDCTVSGNTSIQGGGIQNDNVLTMVGCTISGNISTGSGGGLISYGTTTTLTNCTISNNQSSGVGGGFHIAQGALNLTNCTVANNQASGSQGGGIYVGGTAFLKNTIVASNSASTSSNIAGNSVDPSSSYNFIGNSGTGGLTNGTNSNQVTSASPLLDVLANNGGYMQTIALLAGSPALDKGAAVAGLTTDQRGQPRPFDLTGIAAASGGDNSDIGAYEAQVTCNAITLSALSVPNGTQGVSYLRTITASGGTAPYTFAVTGGSLPTGLSLASDGTLSGIPTVAGTYNFTVTATYMTFGHGCTGSQAYTITISACSGTQTFTVNDLGDAADANPGDGVCATAGGVCTLRAAIQEFDALNACTHVINFSVSGTISMSTVGDSQYGPSALLINRTTTLNGNGVILERNSGVTRLRLFYVTPTGNLTLNNVTLRNGKALGGNGGTGGRAGGGGAGLGGAIFNEGTLTINRSTLTANTAQGGNGGSGSGSQGSGGGGMAADGGNGGGTDGANGGGPNGGLGSTVSGTAGGNGGNGGGGGGGKGSNGGDGGFGGGGGSSGNTGFGRNGGFGGGGGSGSSAGGSNNLGGFGGGNGGGNTAGGGGAGLGGALFNNYQGIITITNSTFSANTVTAGSGGGSPSALGSGLFNRNGTVTLVSSTFNDSVYHLGAANTDTSGGTSRSGGTLTLLNNIISTCSNNSGTVTGPLANKNLIQTNSGCDTPAFTSNPLLTPLGNYGGQTQTHALLAGSPAIDAGDNSVTGAPYNLTTDQTGFARQVNGTVDIGAYESQLMLSPTTLPNAQVSTFYNQTITASGGTSPYTFAATSGSLPTGLSLSSGGVLSGTPSSAGGPFSFVVTATDSSGKKGSRQYNTITICATLSATPGTLPNATAGNGYSQLLTGAGGTAPYTFAVTGGALPTGMSLTQSGTLQGSIVTSGTSNFTVTITDVNGCTGTKAYSLAVDANSCTPTAITVTNNADSGAGSLRQAIADICGGGTITIQPGVGTISLNTVGNSAFGPTALAISNKAVTIIGNGAIIERSSSVTNLRLFYIDPTGYLNLQCVTLRNGVAQGGTGSSPAGGGGAGLGGAIVNQGSLIVRNSTLTNNLALGGSGAAGNGSNRGGGGGGGLGFNGGSTTTFGGGGGGGRTGAGSNASGDTGGAGGLPAGGGGANGVNGTGGGGAGAGGTGNTGGGGGGASGSGSGTGGGGGAGGFGGGGGGAGSSSFGLGVGSGGAGGFGGGGGGGGKSVNNSSGGGAGGFAGGGGGSPTGINGGAGGFSGGSGGTNAGAGGGGGGLGGAIFNYLGAITLINSTLSGNTAQGGNGGNGTTTGSAGGSGYGGGVFNYNGALTVVAATLNGNTVTAGTNGTPAPATPADAGGGGIYNLGDGALARLSIISSILANTSGTSSDCASSITNSGTTNVTGNNSLIENNNACGSPALTADPMLGPLQDNGGLTFTHALLSGSLAINAGDNLITSAPYSLTTDQRGTGNARKVNGTVDIGAYESTASCPTITLSPSSLPTGTLGAAYNNSITAAGGSSPYTFQVTSGSVPTGLTFNSNGTWSGTATAAGTFNFTIIATDNNGCPGSHAYSLTINTPPGITPQAGVSRQQGSPVSNSQIATVSDTETAAGSLTVTVNGNGTATVNGVTVSNIVNTSGTITADIVAACGASNASFTLQVSDGAATTTTTLNVTVTNNAAPTLSYNNASVNFGTATTVNPATAPSDNGSMSSIVVQNVTPSPAPATITVDNTTGVVSVPNNVPAGSYTVTIRATDNCGGANGITDAPFTLTVNASAPTLGNYAMTTLNLGAQATITPSAAPTNTTSIVAKASSGFNGTFFANPTTGVVKVINAHPAGTFTVTVTACGAGGSTTKTFTLTVQSGTACATTPIFTSAPNLSVGSPYGPSVGDFNNDGNQDLAIANNSSASVSIRLGDGAGGFTGSTTVSTGNNPFAIAVGDFNGDGNQDLAVACTSGGVVSIRLGDGAGNFSGTTNISAGSTAKSIALGDFNNDGKLDFVTANFGADTASVRLGDGAGGFSGSTNVSVGDGPGQVRVGDFDGDGDLDFATSNQNAGTVSVRLNDGAGNFSGTTEITVGPNPEFMALGDFNKDGKLDLVTANQNAGTLSVRFGDGAGSFTGTMTLTVSSDPRQVLAGDFNNDGNPDIAVKQASAGTVNYLLGDGLGGFAAPVSVATTGAGGSFLALGDFNQDGRQDFVTSDFNAGLLAVRLGGCNYAPTISDITNQTINEDGNTGALAFTIGDVETAAASLTLSGSSSNTTLVPNANIVFAGSGASRTVTVTPAANQSGTATITITVTDANNGTASDTFTLTVNAVNDLPTISDIANQTINENTATGALSFTIGDVETPAASLTVSGSSSNTTLVPNANISFNGSGANRTVTVTPAANQFGTATITVTVTDGNSGTASDTFVLTVTSVNSAPTITDIANQTINEDGSTGALAFTVGDVETAAGNLTVTGSSSNTTLVPNANIVFGGSGANRTVTVTPAANQSGTATMIVTVTDADKGTTSDTFLLTVNAANDLPTISDIANQTTNEDTATGALSFTVGDVETPAANLTLSGTSSNTTLVPNANIVFNGSGANRTVTVTPAANQSGSATITVTVTDANKGTATDTFSLTVNAVNDPPTISDITNQTINKNGNTGALSLTIGDVETPTGSLTLSGSSSNTALVPNANIVFGGSGANRTVTVTPAANQFGTATITITVTDANSGTASDSFVLTVNDPPTITPSAITRQQGNQPTNLQIATVADAEDAEDTLLVTIGGGSSATSNGVTLNNLIVNAAGQVKADLALTCTATNASFTLAVSDSRGAAATATLNVTVTANTVPAVGNYPNSTVITGGTLTITPDVPPTDNNTVVSVTATPVPNAFTGTFSGNTSSGGVTVTNASPAGSYTVTVTLTDNCGATTTRSFMLTVSACGAVLSKQRELFAANGGTGSFTVTIDGVCSWTATSDNPDWITVTAPVGGFAGAGTVSYSVASNTASTRRTGSITVAGQTFRVWQGAQFGDVPPTHAFYDFIGKLSALGITLGCGGGNYCPDTNTTREQMAIFLERAIGITNPPVPTGQTFQDVPPTLLGYPFIEDFVARGITAGCAAGPPRLYCPMASVTREQMAIFILRGLGVFTPPAGPQTPTFADVPNSGATEYSYEFIEEFARRGITSGCATGPLRYCPTGLVTRGQMAVFLVRAFGM
jgi:CSLREA domain-containing protein